MRNKNLREGVERRHHVMKILRFRGKEGRMSRWLGRKGRREVRRISSMVGGRSRSRRGRGRIKRGIIGWLGRRGRRASPINYGRVAWGRMGIRIDRTELGIGNVK